MMTGRYRYVIGGLNLAAHLAVGLNFFAVSPLLPLAIEDYGINRATAGLLVSLPLLFAALFGLPGARLVAVLGLWRSFLLAWALVGLVTLSAWAPNFAALVSLRLFYGIGFALIITATGPMLMRWFSPREALVMNSLNTAVLSLGVAASVASAVPLADLIGWRETLSLLGVVGAGGAVAWLFLGREGAAAGGGAAAHPPQPAGQPIPANPTASPESSTPQTAGQAIPANAAATTTPNHPPQPAASPAADAGVSRLSLRAMGAVLRRREVLLLIAADAGVLVQYTAFTAWLPTFYSESRGVSLTQAGLITGILPFVGVAAVLLGGILPLRTGSTRGVLVASGLLAVAGGLGAFLLPNLQLIYLAVTLLGIGSWLYVPTLLTLPMQLPGMTPERVAVVWGSFMTFSGLAMFVSPIFVGALNDSTGSFMLGFGICAVPAAALLLAGLLLPGRIRN